MINNLGTKIVSLNNQASVITGVGKSLPSRCVPNSHFESYLETSDEWIQNRTGIKERRWVEPGTSASQLAEPAARQALQSAGITEKNC